MHTNRSNASLRSNSNRDDVAKFNQLSKDIRLDTAKNQLMSAMDSKRTDFLEAALTKYKACLADQAENDKLVKIGENELTYLKLRDELRGAMEREDLEALIEFCNRAESNELSEYKNPLFPDLIDARQLIILLKRRRNKRVPETLRFDNTVMREVALFVHPPQIVHDIIVATLLLLDEYEGSTRDWNYCREILKPYKPSSLKGGLRWRVETFDATQVHPELAARAREILNVYTLPQVHKVSKGCASFFVWAKTQLNEMRSKSSPADLKRQREILGIVQTGETWSAPRFH